MGEGGMRMGQQARNERGGRKERAARACEARNASDGTNPAENDEWGPPWGTNTAGKRGGGGEEGERGCGCGRMMMASTTPGAVGSAEGTGSTLHTRGRQPSGGAPVAAAAAGAAAAVASSAAVAAPSTAAAPAPPSSSSALSVRHAHGAPVATISCGGTTGVDRDATRTPGAASSSAHEPLSTGVSRSTPAVAPVGAEEGGGRVMRRMASPEPQVDATASCVSDTQGHRAKPDDMYSPGKAGNPGWGVGTRQETCGGCSASEQAEPAEPKRSKCSDSVAACEPVATASSADRNTRCAPDGWKRGENADANVRVSFRAASGCAPPPSAPAAEAAAACAGAATA